jgi:choline dehydrogenase-like flavoprotein
MIDDLEALESGAELEADLCVVGAGAAGLALAQEFLGTTTRVVLLESGGLTREAETDRLNEGESEGLGEETLLEGRGRAFGGSTTLWAGQCIPLDDIDLEPRDWVPLSGWPFERAELSAHYERAGRLLGVPGEPYDATLWNAWRVTPPSLDGSKLRHGYTAWIPRPDLGRAMRPRFRRSRNVRVLLHANVTAVETNPAGTAFEHVAVRTLGGATARVRARACVLCCGGIENARLMLMSGDVDAGGLGNAHGNVGRYFQDHPNAIGAVLHTARPRAIQEVYSLLYRRGRRYLPRLVLAPQVQRAERLLNCAANLEYVFADDAINALRRVYRGYRRGDTRPPLRRELGTVSRGLPLAAATAYRRVARGRSTLARPATIGLRVHTEQAPNRDSRVLLSRERDALGSPKARVEWRLTELERRSAEVLAMTVDAEFRRVGLADSELPDWLAGGAEDWAGRFGDSYHHLGTTRMADDPATGVVDRDCQVHGIAGLYASGGSVFPTSGYANPTLTIVALALRLADHLRRGL